MKSYCLILTPNPLACVDPPMQPNDDSEPLPFEQWSKTRKKEWYAYCAFDAVDSFIPEHKEHLAGLEFSVESTGVLRIVGSRKQLQPLIPDGDYAHGGAEYTYQLFEIFNGGQKLIDESKVES